MSNIPDHTHEHVLYKMASSKVAKTYSYKGDEYTFVNTVPKDLVCPICHELLDEAQQTPCGHLFCKKCLKKKKHSGSLKCTGCRSEHNKEPSDDAYNDRRVQRLAVKCPYQPCQWTGPLREIQKHLTDAGCKDIKAKCPNACGEEVTRGSLQQHQRNSCPLRTYHCQFCNKKDTYRNITNEHYEICEQFPLPCPNKCGKQQIPKKEIEHHLAECPEQMVKCPYVKIGCQDTVARRHLDRHKEERKDHHLTIALERVTQLCGAVSELHSICQSLSYDVRSLRKDNELFNLLSQNRMELPVFSLQRKWLENDKAFPSLPWVIKMENFERAKTRSSFMESKPFFTHPTGHQFCLRVHPVDKKDFTSAFIVSMAGPSDHYLQWPFNGAVKVAILNQLADKEHMSEEINIKANRAQPPQIYGCRSDESLRIPHANLQRNKSGNCQYLMDDCLYFRVYVDTSLLQRCVIQ